MFKKILILLTVISIAQLIKCSDDNSVNTNQDSQPPIWYLTIGSLKDTLGVADTLIVGINVKYNGFYGGQYPRGAMEPVIIKIVKDSSYTSRVLYASCNISERVCTRDFPPSDCVINMKLYQVGGLAYKQRYFYYAELVNDSTVRSSILSIFLK